jgi:hypothetical protein
VRSALELHDYALEREVILAPTLSEVAALAAVGPLVEIEVIAVKAKQGRSIIGKRLRLSCALDQNVKRPTS